MANFQGVCDSANQPDAMDAMRLVVQSSSGGPLAALKAKFEAFLLALGIVNDLDTNKIDELGGIEAVKLLIGEAYDSYIAPIDIPYVPNLLETRVVDPLLRGALLWAVSYVHGKFGS